MLVEDFSWCRRPCLILSITSTHFGMPCLTDQFSIFTFIFLVINSSCAPFGVAAPKSSTSLAASAFAKVSFPTFASLWYLQPPLLARAIWTVIHSCWSFSETYEVRVVPLP